MRKILLSILVALSSYALHAQYATEALKYSQTDLLGTAAYVGRAGAIGAIGLGFAKSLVCGATGGALGDIVEQGINKFLGNQSKIDWPEVGESAAFGALTGAIEGAGETIGEYIEDFYSSEDTIKSLAKGIKDSSVKKVTNKKAINEAKKVAEETQMTEKVMVEKTTNVMAYTLGFYKNLQDE